MDAAEREWWRRVPGVLVAPRAVFLALRSNDPADLVARQEPVLAIVLLAGMAGVLMTPRWGTLLDEPELDGLLAAVLTFVAGGIYGTAAYLLVGGALHLGARGLGSAGTWRLARHVLAFACVPLLLALLVLLPVQLAAFGGDAFRAGGADDGALGGLVAALELGLLAWALGLLLLGVRTVYGWTWARAAGALGLLVLLLAAFLALPTAL